MNYIGAGPLVSLVATAFLAVVLFAAFGFGRSLIGMFEWPVAVWHRGETAVASVGLGLAMLSMGIFLLAVGGVFNKPTASLLILSGVFLALFWLKRVEAPRVQETLGEAPQIFWAAAVAVFSLAWLQALAPATAMDALAYHLYLPKEFLRLGRMEFLPLTRESLWPFNTEMLFMLGMLFQGTALAQLFHWVFFPLTALAVYFFTLRVYGVMPAAWAMIFFIFTPVVFAQSGAPYVDLSLAFFVFMAVSTFLMSEKVAGVKPYILSGLFCGAAVGSKYLGLGPFLILLFFILIRSRLNLRKTSYFLLSCGVVGSTWYWRSWWVAGNPFFPFFHTIFNRGYYVDIDAGVSMGGGPAAFLLFPWNVSLYPNAFGGQMLGALFLLLLPAALPLARRSRPVSRYLAAFGFLYVAFIFTQSQHVRFLVAAAPFLSIGATAGFLYARSRGGIFKAAAVATVAALLFIHAGIFLYRVKNIWPVAAGRIDAETWLKENERSYKGYDYIRRHAAPEEKFLNAAEVRYFYAPEDRRITHLFQENVRLRAQTIPIVRYLESEKFDGIWVTDLSDPEILQFIRSHRYELVFSYEAREKPDTFRNFIYKKSS